MVRRKRPRTHVSHDRWLVSYADFITLLFAFFVVLYASAQVDQRKVGRLALAIQVAFQELGVFPASTTQIPLDIHEPMPFSTVQVIENARHNTELGRVSSPPEDSLTAASEEANLTTLQAELQQALRHEIASHAVALHREAEGLVISLREFGFFDSGSGRRGGLRQCQPSIALHPFWPSAPAASASKVTPTMFPYTQHRPPRTGNSRPHDRPNWCAC